MVSKPSLLLSARPPATTISASVSSGLSVLTVSSPRNSTLSDAEPATGATFSRGLTPSTGYAYGAAGGVQWGIAPDVLIKK